APPAKADPRETAKNLLGGWFLRSRRGTGRHPPLASLTGPYRSSHRELKSPAWSEFQKPLTGWRPVTEEVISFTFFGSRVITWSTWWSKSATLPPAPAPRRLDFRQQPSGLPVLRSRRPALTRAW